MELYHTPEPVSISEAIKRGFIWVYGPFVPLTLGVPFLVVIGFFGLAKFVAMPEGASSFVNLIAVISAIIAPWLWWSYSVPKWRLWAYERVENIPELIEEAVKRGLIWPPGHFFEKTEIKSKEHAAKEKEWEAKRS